MKHYTISSWARKGWIGSVMALGTIVIWTLLSAHTSEYVNRQDDTTIAYKVFLDKELAAISLNIERLQDVAKAYKTGGQNLEELQMRVANTRMAYKRIEGMLTYYFPEHIDAYINGAPLDHVTPRPTSKDSKDLNYYLGSVENYKNSLPLDMLEAGHYSGNTYDILPPVGLQRLDELAFSDEAPTKMAELVTLTDQLHTSFNVLKETLILRKYYYDYEVIEASRLQIVRILGRGITGFDTPGSLNAMQEAAASLSGIADLLQPLIQKSSIDTQNSLQIRFQKGKQYLKRHDNFNKFDRLVFIKSYLNPLYKGLLELQMELQIPSSADKFNTTPSWNANSSNLFDAEFLNPYYYSMLKASEDGPQLQQLGERLFFDTQLSHGNTISCASCHDPQRAYADGEATSLSSVQGKRLARNAPTLINAVFSDRYFYDLRALDLEDQAEHVIASHMEFNTSHEEIIEKLNQDKSYAQGFNAVYGTDKINRYQFSGALASYVISLNSFNSDFDKYIRGEKDHLDPSAKRGFNLFMGKANCATCHYAPTFSGLTPPLYRENESEVLGVLKEPGSFQVDQDLGRMENGIKKDHQNIYNRSFKTTTVRNAGLTAPYFHNGAYDLLEDVISFYNSGGAAGIGLSYEVPNQTLSPEPLGLSDKDIQDIKAFIVSLNDVPDTSH
ncbi:cytochrome-c peroxidase [Sediminibacter sp. Hel_I_10]|uniref:cytochrome-c peroxidase n=1 Tax=Sediminibacter sp. Hel_I_10 TaxID=1392490 RepID=UPI000B054970|nr:cytochrome c peroxidase [Sediminibacter sp. Hel_I_10]